MDGRGSPFVCLALNSTQTSKDDLVFACESAARVITISPFYYVTVASAGAEIDVEFAAGFTYGTISDCSAAFISATVITMETWIIMMWSILAFFCGVTFVCIVFAICSACHVYKVRSKKETSDYTPIDDF